MVTAGTHYWPSGTGTRELHVYTSLDVGVPHGSTVLCISAYLLWYLGVPVPVVRYLFYHACGWWSTHSVCFRVIFISRFSFPPILSQRTPFEATQRNVHWFKIYIMLPGTARAHVLGLLLSVPNCNGLSNSSVFEFDVIVYGATPSGVAAAVGAAREGAKVALLEPGQYTGGCMSGGLGLADYGLHSEQVIGGFSEEFFRRIAKHYNTPFYFPAGEQCGDHHVPWVSEPHVAEQVFEDMLSDANVPVYHETRIVSAVNEDAQISSLQAAHGNVFKANVFVDGTYEGALMKMAGVQYTWGREANTTYNETAAGRLPTAQEQPDWPFGDRTETLPQGINPFLDSTNTTTIPHVWGGDVASPGSADRRVGGYDWRLTLTTNESNRIPLPVPDDYDPAEFELLRRAIKRGFSFGLPNTNTVPNGKTDWKMFSLFGEQPNAQWAYPNGTWEEQQAIVAEFKRYALSLIHFFTVDPVVPSQWRKKMAEFGLCKDEYNRSDHWMPQLYVRTALRMVSDRVLVQPDVVTTKWNPGAGDAIGMGAYTVDIPGPVQTIIVDGEVATEGALKVRAVPAPFRLLSACGMSVIVDPVTSTFTSLYFLPRTCYCNRFHISVTLLLHRFRCRTQ